MSLRPSSLSPESCSGLMYSGVPTTSPVLVTFWPLSSPATAFAMPKSTTFHDVRAVPALDDHDVVGLDIAVHDGQIVGGGQCVGRLLQDARRADGRQGALALDDVRQGGTLDELHGEIDDAVGRFAEVIDLAHVGGGRCGSRWTPPG